MGGIWELSGDYFGAWRASWEDFVRQVGISEGKLELRWPSAKLELQGFLETPKEAPREPKRPTRDIEVASRRVNFGLGRPPKID